MGKYIRIYKKYIWCFRLIIYVLYSFTRSFSTFYIGLLVTCTEARVNEYFIYMLPPLVHQFLICSLHLPPGVIHLHYPALPPGVLHRQSLPMAVAHQTILPHYPLRTLMPIYWVCVYIYTHTLNIYIYIHTHSIYIYYIECTYKLINWSEIMWPDHSMSIFDPA